MNDKGKGYKPGYYGKKTMQKSAWLDANIKRWNSEDADIKRGGGGNPGF